MDLKQSGQCPKCNSLSIWNNTQVHENGKHPTRRWIIVISARLPWNRKYAFKDEYVCIDCGYSESFIDEEGLKTIREFGVTDLLGQA